MDLATPREQHLQHLPALGRAPQICANMQPTFSSAGSRGPPGQSPPLPPPPALTATARSKGRPDYYPPAPAQGARPSGLGVGRGGPPPLPPSPPLHSLLLRPNLVPVAPPPGLAAPGALTGAPPRVPRLPDLGHASQRSALGLQPPPGPAAAAASGSSAGWPVAARRADASDGAYGTGGPAQPLLAASPEELYVDLLEALARRCGGLEAGTASATASAAVSAGASGGRSREAGLAAAAASAVAPPPPARVLANAAWGGVRLLLELWPQLQAADSVGRAAPPSAAAHPGASDVPTAAGFGSEQSFAATPPGSALVSGAGTSASPQLLRRRATAALRVLLARVPDAAPSLEPQHVSNLLYSVARLAERLPEVLEPEGGGGAGDHCGEGRSGVTAPPGPMAAPPRAGAATQRLVAALLDASLPKLSSFGPQALSNSLYAVAVLGVPPPRPWLRGWIEAAAGQLLRADPQHIANMLWALVRLGCHPGDPWVSTALQAAALKAPAFTTQGLCNTLWGLAKLGFVPDDPAKAQSLLPLLAGLGSSARECGAQDVGNGMWALARLCSQLPPAPPQPPPPHSPDAPQQRLPPPLQPLQQQPQGASAAAAARDALRAAGRRLLDASSRHLHAYNPQQLANVAWAAATLGLQPPPDWAAQFWPAALATLPAMRTEELVATAMASARLRLQPPDPWVAALLELTSQAMQQVAASAPAAAASPTAADDPRVTGAKAAGNGAEVDLPSRIQDPVQGQFLDRFQATGRSLASLLWCVEAWGLRVPVAWTASVLGRLEALAAGGGLEPAALATALQAMARMGLRPDYVVAGWTERVLGACLSTYGEGHGEGVGTVEGDGASEGLFATVGMGSAGRPANGPGGCFNARCARMVLWSLARLRCRVSHDAAGTLALTAAECDDPTTAAAAGAAWGGAKEGTEAPEKEEGWGQADAGQSGEKGARNVCLALWALACLSSRPRLAVMQRLAWHATADVPRASESELLAIVRAFAALGFRPGANFRRAAEARAVRLASAFEEEQVASLLAACARLQWRFSGEAFEALHGSACRHRSLGS